MFNKKKEPYDYITKDNFDIVRECLMQGLHSNNPNTIVENLKKFTDIPEEAILAIVSKEIGEAFDAWRGQ
jgi:hypothetical protein